MSSSGKIRRVLVLFLCAFSMIFIRVWHLAVVQREGKLQEAQKPQQRTILVRADRGVIYDRFHIPMALNKICYNAAIYYSQIAQIPAITWKSDEQGRQVRCYERKVYIRNLACRLADLLKLDPERVEDLIHSKAALFPHVPFVLKANLSEEEHCRLRMMENEWPGVYAEISSYRHYPLSETGCHITGMLGAISRKEYMAIAQEISDLEKEAELYGLEDTPRLAELKEKAYGLSDLVGKRGIEASFEEELRGFFGKKTFEVDQKGRFVREIASKEPIAGQDIVLSISSELQSFAESLLMKNELFRDGRSRCWDRTEKKKKLQKQPWIKGGSIVALDPKTGEVLALASFPLFDPNDFIAQNSVDRWLENKRFIASLWDGTAVLKRKRNDVVEEQPISWEFFLDAILPLEGPLRPFFTKMDDVKGAIQLQEDYEAMLYFTQNNLAVPSDVQKRLDAILLPPQDKAFAADLCRIAVYAPAFSDALIQQVGSMKISAYRALAQQIARKEAGLKLKAKEEFRQNEFRQWKEKEQKNFLKQMRQKEKEEKRYARPYIEYLDEKEKELFASHWETERLAQLVSSDVSEELLRTFRSFHQMTRPVLGKYRKKMLENDLASTFYPSEGFGFSRSYAFECCAPQGSIFKLVTGYEGLIQGKHLTLVDELSKEGVAYTLDRVVYPRIYRGGRLPRSVATSMGKIDFMSAIARTSNPYFAILAGDHFNSPEDLANAARQFGYGEQTGIELPGERKGYVPTDLTANRTGLYATAIGQHTLLNTPLHTATMLASIANGGSLLRATILKTQTPEIKRQIPMPTKVRKTLVDAMDQVVWSSYGTARPAISRSLWADPALKQSFLALQHQMVGKTSTAEIVANLSYNPTSKPQIYNHVGFGSIAFTNAKHEEADLIVVVLLRFGDSGKEAAPLAAQMIQKWREIKKKH